METKYTVEEVLKITIEQLRVITVPVEEIESIGFPVKRAIQNLTECIRAMEMAKEANNGRETDSGERDGDSGASA